MGVTMTDVKTWILQVGIGIVAILAVVGFGNLIRYLASSPHKLLDGPQSVATEWNNSVRRLGLNPIYPPQEDLYVGDIFAVVKSSDNSYSALDEVFGDHAIKLWHVDMTKVIKATYAPLPVFPETQPHAAGDEVIWQQKPSDDLFAAGGRKTLPLVAFPAFSIHNSRAATVSGSTGQGLFGWLSGIFGISRDDEETEQLSFPSPETYGVDAIDAQVALFGFCNDPRTASFCTEFAIRNMLSMVVGKEIWRQKIDANTKQPGYASEVELMLVRQVFLTRSIIQVRSADSASGAAARLIGKLKDISDKPSAPAAGSPGDARGSPAANPTLPSLGPQAGAGAEAPDPQGKKSTELRALLDSMNQAGPSGGVSAISTDGTIIALKQVYQRPLAIGFRSVSQQPSPNTTNGSKVAGP